MMMIDDSETKEQEVVWAIGVVDGGGGGVVLC